MNVYRGKTIAEKHLEAQQKKKKLSSHKLTASQRKKVDELVRKVTERNLPSAKLPGSMEIR